MAFSPDGRRLFVTLQNGNVRVVKDGALLARPFVTVATDTFFERGLLGVAVDPNFASNGQVFTYHTTTASGASKQHVVTRFTADATGDIASGIGTTIFSIPAGSAGNHNGGALNFGPDGKLYVAVGDGANTPANAQSLTSLNGKILRINTDGTIPTDNPFFASTTGTFQAIYALGLRNPFTFAFQPGTGIAYVNDVGSSGANRREETNPLSAGANFGWPTVEGIQSSPPAFANGTYTNPVYVYTDGFSMTGSVFYNPTTPMFPPSFVGRYFLADFVSGFIRTIPTSGTAPVPAQGFATGASGPVDLDIGPDGALFYLEYNTRRVMRVFVNTSLLPTVTDQPDNVTVPVGQAGVFNAVVGGPGTIGLQWQRSNSGAAFTNIVGATSPSYTLSPTTLSDTAARFRVVATNASGSVVSEAATLTVINNTAPAPSITTPDTNLLFSGGNVINFSGSAFDTEDGNLPASAFSWDINYITGSTLRPFAGPFNGVTSGSFTAATSTPYLLTDVAYRITLTVTDSAGTVSTTSRDVLPQVSTITLQTNPPGIGLTLDDVPTASPVSVNTVVGLDRNLGAPASVVISGQTFQFDNWSNGQSRLQVLTTPAINTTYTATFRDITAPVAQTPTYVQDAPRPQVTVSFSENVINSLTSGDVLLTNLTTNTVVPTSSIVLTYAAQSNTATFSFPGLLADGNYTLTIARSGVTDAAGNALASDISLSFFSFGGDFNLNRVVDFNDLVVLARNFNQTGRINSQGDADYNGTVDFNDLVILARNFNRSLIAPPIPIFDLGVRQGFGGGRASERGGKDLLR